MQGLTINSDNVAVHPSDYPSASPVTGRVLARKSFVTSVLLPGVLALVSLLSQPVLAIDDALNTSATLTDNAQHALLLDVARAGERLVAVGERGFVLYSDDLGNSWTQAQVPVAVTLTAVSFPEPTRGWAVGHDGVVLSTRDGGQSWTKQLDGYRINQITRRDTLAHFELKQRALAMASDNEQPMLEEALESLQILVEDNQVFSAEGATRPLLDVWFKNAHEGWVVGAFGLFLHTTDGGESWRSLAHNMPNPDGFHYNAIAQAAGTLFIAGEAGTFYRSADNGEQWQRLELPYEGSFFGVLGHPSATQVVTFGLRGHAFLSADLGDSWQQIDTGVPSTLAGGTMLADGSLMMVGSSGAVVFRSADEQRFVGQLRPDRLPYSAVVEADPGAAVVVGYGGARRMGVDGSNLEEK